MLNGKQSEMANYTQILDYLCGINKTLDLQGSKIISLDELGRRILNSSPMHR